VTAPTDLEKVGLVLDRDHAVPDEKVDDDQTTVWFESCWIVLQGVYRLENGQELQGA
jgi:hypothetical protein